MWNADIELATLMKALKGLPNNAVMRVLESNQRLLSVWPHSTGFFLPQHLKRTTTYIFQDSPTSTPSMALKSKFCRSAGQPPGLWHQNKQDNLSELFLHGIQDTHVWFGFFFFPPSNYPRKKPLPPRLNVNKNMGFTSSFATGWLQDLEKKMYSTWYTFVFSQQPLILYTMPGPMRCS